MIGWGGQPDLTNSGQAHDDRGDGEIGEVVQELIRCKGPPELPNGNRPALDLDDIFLEEIDMVVEHHVGNGEGKNRFPPEPEPSQCGNGSQPVNPGMQQAQAVAIDRFAVDHGLGLQGAIADKMLDLQQQNQEQHVIICHHGIHG